VRPTTRWALDDGAPHAMPDRLAAAAEEAAGAPAGLYVVDVDGSCLFRVSGGDDLPEKLHVPRGLGPELPLGLVDEVRARLRERMSGAQVEPLVLHGRAIAFLVARSGPDGALAPLASAAAPAVELAGGYTDRILAARRTQTISPAAEMQQGMLPARIAALEGLDLACGVLPAYDVGGDWFDHAENADGTWLALADGVGKGPRAAALSAIALGALRAARRNGDGLEAAVQMMHTALWRGSEEVDFVTAVLGRWLPEEGAIAWVNAGHPRPLVVARDGSMREVGPTPTYPLGLFEDGRRFTAVLEPLLPGERAVLYSDGVSERRRGDRSLLGLAGIEDALRAAPDDSAVASVRAIQAAVLDASPEPLRDDATLLVVRRHG